MRSARFSDSAAEADADAAGAALSVADLGSSAAAVDAHQHFWPAGTRRPDPAAPELDGEFAPGHLAAELEGSEIGRTVLVQCTAGSAENDRLARYAAVFLPVGAVVAWLPLLEPRPAREELARIRSAVPLLRGVRTALPADATAADLVPALTRVARAGLVWEVVLARPEHAALAAEVAQALPDLPVVIDHLGTPPLAGGDPAPWRAAMARLAALPGTAVKVSVGRDALAGWEWSAAELRPWVRDAFDAFGAHRCMLAGNWPVIRAAASHAQAWGALRAAVAAAGASPHERARAAGGTAREWFGVPDGAA